jgi:hypothetical protein
MYGYTISVFCVFGRQAFGYGDFEDITSSLMYLFNAGLANYDFKDNDRSSAYQQINPTANYEFKIFLLIFIVISYVLMLNLLIALLSNVYDKLNVHSLGLYLNEIIHQRPLKEYSRHYSGLIGAPFPFNAIPFVLTPAYIFVKSEKMNQIIMGFEFLLVNCMVFFLFFFGSIFLVPPVYIKICLTKFFLISRKLTF